MSLRKLVLTCLLLAGLAGAAFTQSAADIAIVPLTVDKGFPINVRLSEKLRFKENEPVRATVMEPVYSFDREVIPAGTEVEGTIIGFEKPGKWKRISSMLGGNFTPLREPQISFHTLVFSDGTRVTIETSVVPGTEKIVGSDDYGFERSSFVATSKKSEKDRLKKMLWGIAPYHALSLPTDTRLSAVLQAPLDFGVATFDKAALNEIGSAPPADTVASVRLITPLNSRTAQPGAPVEALLMRPLFSKDHRLLFPVGARLQGNVSQVTRARSRHRNGQLAITLSSIVPPDSWTSGFAQPQQVDGNIVSVQVTHDMKDLRIDGNAARIVQSKKRFIAPAWSFIKAERSINASEDAFGTAFLGAYRSKFLKQMTGGSESGFGLPASITGAMVPPVGIGLGFFGLSRSIYSTFLRRGDDINLPDNTTMEVRLERRAVTK